jgi:hypothetical protein
VVRDRLGVYRGSTKPLVDYYRERPTFGSSTARDQDGVANGLESSLTT